MGARGGGGVEKDFVFTVISYNHKSSRKCPNKDKLVDKKF